MKIVCTRFALSTRSFSSKYKAIRTNLSIDYDAEEMLSVYEGDHGSKSPEQLDNSDKKITTDRIKTFKDLGVNSDMRRSLRNCGITVPTRIQQLALPATISGKGSCIIQSETGSGKTLSFLLPALQETQPGLTSLIVTPTRELATQMFFWAQKLTGNRKDSRRVGLLLSGEAEENLMNQFRKNKPHLLIGTPKILLNVIKEKMELGHSLQRLILDEGDKLLQPLHEKASWRKRRVRDIHPRPTRLLVETLVSRKKLQLICASATVPLPLKHELQDIGWGKSHDIIATSSSLSIPTNIHHSYISCDIESGDEKSNVLTKHFRFSKLTSTLVFIHRDASISSFVKKLSQSGLKTKALYTRIQNPSMYEHFLKKFETGTIQLVIGTEETVRGLDFPFLEVMYLTEVPRNAGEYLHAAGRVGRCGREGKVIVIVENGKEMARLMKIYEQLRIKQYEESYYT